MESQDTKDGSLAQNANSKPTNANNNFRSEMSFEDERISSEFPASNALDSVNFGNDMERNIFSDIFEGISSLDSALLQITRGDQNPLSFEHQESVNDMFGGAMLPSSLISCVEGTSQGLVHQQSASSSAAIDGFQISEHNCAGNLLTDYNHTGSEYPYPSLAEETRGGQTCYRNDSMESSNFHTGCAISANPCDDPARGDPENPSWNSPRDNLAEGVLSLAECERVVPVADSHPHCAWRVESELLPVNESLIEFIANNNNSNNNNGNENSNNNNINSNSDNAYINSNANKKEENNDCNVNDNSVAIISGSGTDDVRFDNRREGVHVESDERVNAIKAEIVSHPLFSQLLDAHVGCLKVATPLDQIPLLDLQLEKKHLVIEKYEKILKEAKKENSSRKVEETTELNFFMTHFVCLLQSFKSQLEQHVLIQAREAVLSCWELEQSLIALTGAEPRPGTGATMSEDEVSEDEGDLARPPAPNASDFNCAEENLDGCGPFIPTEDERSIMERMREELKKQLSDQGYKSRIADVREEIMRKRRAGKLPNDTTQILKAWWNSHSKWPYPTEEEKANLVRETGLELKQINNWFINQRKRNWHNNSQKGSKRKLKE